MRAEPAGVRQRRSHERVSEKDAGSDANDRLGRIDDETPFIVERFVKTVIEVWSVTEGQQRFDTHVDKLTNYILFWQASGESIKTSIRTKEALGQLVEKGRIRNQNPKG